MNPNWQEIARNALVGAETDAMSFPQCVQLLDEAGFDGYGVDFRSTNRSYYRPDGVTIELETERSPAPVAARFNAAAIRAAIREAQAQVAGYTYKGFCTRIMAAGCAGYIVSILGERVLYYGRTGETYTEYFPGAAPPGQP